MSADSRPAGPGSAYPTPGIRKVWDAQDAAINAAAASGGAEPPRMTVEQGETLGRLARDFRATDVTITYEPFDLPTGYVLVQLRPGDFTAGIAPDGRASS